MEENKSSKGFQEIAHTADLALQVWGRNLTILFSRAARGMLKLMEITKSGKKIFTKKIDLHEDDLESLLVEFLSSILEDVEKNQIVYDDFNLHVTGSSLSGILYGHCLKTYKREIKAVTFHNLKIIYDGKLYQTALVFDI